MTLAVKDADFFGDNDNTEEQTILGEQKRGRGRPPKNEGKSNTKATPVKVKEAQEKIYLIFQGFARLTKRDFPFQESDFHQEGNGLSRLADKYPVVSKLIIAFDPIVIILGLIAKFNAMGKKEQPKTQQTEQQNQQPNIVNFGR